MWMNILYFALTVITIVGVGVVVNIIAEKTTK